HEGGMLSVAPTPDGTQFVTSGHKDKAVRLWDLKRGTPLRSIPVSLDFPQVVGFAPAGRQVGVYCPTASRLEIVDLDGGRVTHQIGGQGTAEGFQLAAAAAPQGILLGRFGGMVLRRWP